MDPKKVIIVEAEDAKRQWKKAAFEMAGYKVLDFKDGQSALMNIVQDGHAPFVLAGTFSMGDVYTSDEMKRCLAQHSQRTNVNYGIVAYNVPQNEIAKKPLVQMRIPGIAGDDTAKITQLVEAEFARIA